MDNKYSPQTQIVLDNAQARAKSFNHTAVGSEHLLLALVSQVKTPAGVLLADFGLSEDNV
ncbi:MAG: Clp protease N-terminal domain-containing protein, partial [Lactobacillaceae bacterium]|nr:Clp protease N-terminal domain-containing protein [Lactobacillaceae bacterium]